LILKSDAETALMFRGLSPLFLHLTKMRQPSSHLASSAAAMKSARQAIAFPSRLSTARIRRPAQDAENSHLVNFPFACTIALCLVTGLLAIGWGIAVPDISLTVTGIIFTLLGGSLFGSSFSND